MIGNYFLTVCEMECVRCACMYMSACVLFVSGAELNCIQPVFIP